MHDRIGELDEELNSWQTEAIINQAEQAVCKGLETNKQIKQRFRLSVDEANIGIPGRTSSCTYCVSVSAGDKAVRRAELIDFQQERGEAAAPASSLFADSLIGPASRPRSWSQSDARGQSSNRFEKLTFNLPTIGNCPPKPYRSSGLLAEPPKNGDAFFYPLVQRTACDAGLPIGLMDALLIQESRYNPMALSPKGAFGLGQLMPDTAKELGVNRYSLQGNLSGAARYLLAAS